MNEQLLELIEQWTKLQNKIFYEEMADYMDHKLVKELKQEASVIEQDIDNFASRSDAFELFTTIIEEKEPDIFNKMISDLDSVGGETLFDVFDNYNNIHKSKIVIPYSVLKKIKIKF